MRQQHRVEEQRQAVEEELQRLWDKVTELEQVETSRKQTEETLYSQEQTLKTLLENTPDVISRFNKEYLCIYVNSTVEQMMGLPPESYIGKSYWELGISEEQAVLGQTATQMVFETGKSAMIEYEIPTPFGLRYYQSRLVPEFARDGTVEAVLNIIRDVSTTKRAEEQFRRTTRALRVRSECTRLLVQTPADKETDEADLIQKICTQMIEVGGYALAWVGFAEQDEAKTMRCVANAGQMSDYLKDVTVNWSEDTEFGRGPGGTSIRTGQTVLIQNILTSPEFAPWRERALQYGFRTVLALPLIAAGQILGNLNIYADQLDAFDPEEIGLLEDLASDLAYRISSLRVRAERNRATRELNRWAHIFKHINLGVLIGSAETLTIEMVNPAFASMHGYTNEELIGQPVSSLFPPEAIPDLIKAKEITERQNRYEYETTHIRKDGSIFPVSIDITIIRDQEGKVLYRVSSLQDITERKQAEKALVQSETRFRQAVDNFPHVFGIYDKQGRIEYLNSYGLKATGYSLEEIVGHTNEELFPVQVNEPPLLCFKRSIETRTTQTVESTVEIPTTKNKETVVATYVPLLDEDGEIHQVLAISFDITKRKQAEEALQKSQEQLLQSQKLESIGRLAGGIAHDFNNLLTTITGYSDLILNNLDPEDWIWSDLNEIGRAADRAAALTRQLLAFSRQQVLQPKILNLNTVVAEMDKLLRRLIGEDVELVTLLDPQLHLILADPGQLEQVIMNLAVNARDAMPEGGRLTLETANIELSKEYSLKYQPEIKTGSYIMLTVSDTGLGMDTVTQDRIFEPFFTTKAAGKGTGLGLATSYGIIKQSGGYIWVYSEVGVGTTFKIYLPQVVDAVVEIQPDSVPDPISLHSSKTILLVEDEVEVRSLMYRVLAQYGYTILEAANGNEALELCKQYTEPIDLVITDLIMPQMGGSEMVKKLSELIPEAKVLLMSGYTDRILDQQHFLNDYKTFMQKPFTPIALAQKVREVLAIA